MSLDVPYPDSNVRFCALPKERGFFGVSRSGFHIRPHCRTWLECCDEADFNGSMTMEKTSLATPSPNMHSGMDRTVLFTAPSGGTGLTTLASMFALRTSAAGAKTALVDLNVHSGGMDVTLGIEGEPGLRMSGISAPLGRLSGAALDAELPHWEGISVLAADPWNNAIPKVWEIRAAIEALAQTHDVVVLDSGQTIEFEEYGLSDQMRAVMLVEMSVLGMARAKSHVTRVTRQVEHADMQVVGIHPRMACSQSVRMHEADARAYLQLPVIGSIMPRRALGLSIVQGLGIPGIPRSYRHLFDRLVHDVLSFASAPSPVSRRRHVTRS